MQMRDYVARFDSLASEDALFDIPFRKEYILSRIGRGKKVLDVGCLGGKLSRLILDQNNEVWGIELNSNSASVARERGIRVKIADVEEGLPFEDASFDVVNAGEILEHLYDTRFFFCEAKRVLKSRGMILFSVPNLNSIENRIRVVTGGYLTTLGAYPEDHFGERVRVFNRSKIEELCEQTGFRLTHICGIPNLESHGKWVDTSLGWMGKILPSFSKILLVTAEKIS